MKSQLFSLPSRDFYYINLIPRGRWPNPKKWHFHEIFSKNCSGVGTYPGMAVMHGGSCMINFHTIDADNNPSIVAMLCFATCEGFLPALMV